MRAQIFLQLFWGLGIYFSEAGFPPQIPYLFWTVNTNQVFYLNNTENWIRQNEPPDIFRFSYGDSKHKHLGCSFDMERKYLLFSDNSANTISLLGEKSNGGLQGIYVHIGTSSGVGHVAVDWISSNVYWSDSLFGWIGLQALPKNIESAAFNLKFKVVVDKFLDIPSGLAVHASKRFLFWTDTGIQPKIERSLLDGSKRKVLVWSGILYPVSIAVDVHSNTIYFTDSARETVESCDLEGNARRILFYETNSVFYGIETFKNYVIVSDQTSNRILVLSNSTGQKMVTPLRTPSPPFSLGLFSQDNQPIGSTDCDTFGCSQICIIESSGARCLCEDGYSLLADGKTCTVTDKTIQRSILFAAGPQICHYPITVINSFKYMTISTPCDLIATTPGNVSYFAIAMHSNQVFYAKDDTIFSQNLFGNVFVSNFSTRNKISGLDYDWVTDTVYWSEESVAKIFYWNVSSDRVANTGEITVPGLGIPKALKIDPFKMRVFYIDSSTTPSIKVIYLTNNRIETLENYDISNPIFLHFDRRKDTVFWSDNGRSTLGSVGADGLNTKIKQLPEGSILTGIAVYKDYLLWLSNTHSNHSLNVQENTTLGSDTIIKMPLGVVAPRVLDLRVFDRALQPSVREPCITDNDGCQHICIVEGESSQCACHVGYTLQSDRKSCLSAPVASNFLLTTDIQIKGIYQINLENKNISAVDVLAGNPNIPDYDNVRRKLVWWDKSKNTIMESSLDGTDGKAVKGGVRNVGGLVIDHSTGNIFYASDNNIYVTTNSGNVYRKLESGVNIGSLQVDSKRGIMVWIEGRPNPKIIRSYMDGTNVETIISNSTHFISTPMDLAIDNSDGSLVWCDDTLDKIDIVSMITLTSRTVISNRGEYPVSVAVLGEFIYYIARDRRSITKISKIIGSKPDDVVSSPLFGKLLYLTIYEESKTLHKLCSNQNGMCSKFCLPRGENDRVCDCEDGNIVNSEGLCPGDVQCPLVIDHGRIPTTCRRLTGDVCEFTCNEGYQLGVPETTMLLCGSNGKWNQTSELCKVKKCQDSFENGNIASGCSLEVDTTCGYTCHDGYIKSGSVSLVCNKNGAWNEEISQLCKLKDKGNTDTIIGGVAGSAAGLVLIIVIIVVVVCMRIRRKKKRDSENQPINVSYVCPSVSGSVLSTSQISTYTTLTDDRESVYSEIREEFDQPKTVEIPPIHDKHFKEMGVDIQKGSSIRSERYSIFPGKNADEGGYLEACHVGNSNDFLPVPDYEHDDWLEPSPRNGYLDAVMINDHYGNPKRKDDARFKHPYE